MDQDRLRAILCGRRIDAEALGHFLTENVHLRIGSAVTAVGKPRALAELARLLDRIEAVGGVFHEVWQVDETCFVETEITYADLERSQADWRHPDLTPISGTPGRSEGISISRGMTTQNTPS